jgi:hypothetical protein
MVLIKRLVLDVLKPKEPNSIEFAKILAEQGENYNVTITVEEVDDKTETVVVVVKGDEVRLDILSDSITNLGGSLHSIDEVEVVNVPNVNE